MLARGKPIVTPQMCVSSSYVPNRGTTYEIKPIETPDLGILGDTVFRLQVVRPVDIHKGQDDREAKCCCRTYVFIAKHNHGRMDQSIVSCASLHTSNPVSPFLTPIANHHSRVLGRKLRMVSCSACTRATSLVPLQLPKYSTVPISSLSSTTISSFCSNGG